MTGNSESGDPNKSSDPNDRAERAAALRIDQGRPWREIVDQLGYGSLTEAQRDVAAIADQRAAVGTR